MMKIEDRIRRSLHEAAGRVAPNDRWDEINHGPLHFEGPHFERGPATGRRVLVIAVALALTTASILVVGRAFYPSSSTSVSGAAHDGMIAFGVIGPRTGPDGTLAQDIDVVAPDGSGLRNLTPDEAAYFSPAWSPDGTKIAYVRFQRDGGSFDEGIFVANADNTQATKVYVSGLPHPISLSELAWSPDGTKIGFVQTKWPAEGSEADAVMQLIVMNADGTGATALGGTSASDGGQITSFSWSPDGGRIVLTRQVAQGVRSIPNLFLMSADGTSITQLTDDGISMNPSWSPDGSHIAFEVASDHYHRRSIYLVDASGGDRTQLTEGPWMDSDPVWSPDGRQIAFIRVEGESNAGTAVRASSLMIMNADGTDQHAVATAEEANGSPTNPSWQPLAAESKASQCRQAHTTGDFDGDGVADRAELVAIVSADVSCEDTGQVVSHLLSEQIDVRFGSGQTLERPFTACKPCMTGGETFTPTDLDGDGRDELAIDVGPGAATDYVGFYRVDPHGIHPLVVADPADPPYVKPGPAILGGGFDSGLLSPIECRVDADGTRALVSVHAENMTGPITGPWKVHSTTMFLRGDDLVVVAVAEDQSKGFFSRGSEVFQNGCS